MTSKKMVSSYYLIIVLGKKNQDEGSINLVTFFFPAARNHVNRMCLAADVPLVESGTAGYLGQVTVIKKVRLKNV